MAEADKYEVVMLKRMEMTHREVIEYLEQRNIEITRKESFLMAIEDTFT